MRARRCDILFPLLAGIASGCAEERVQSSLHPAGPAAESIAWLWWVMFWVYGAVFVLVLVLTVLAVMRRRLGNEAGPPLGHRFVIAGGIILPALVLTGMLFASIITGKVLRRTVDPAVTIRIVGHQWWWEVHYPEHGITTANELHIPAGRPVQLELRAGDVIHSFWVPRLSGKMDLMPDKTNTLIIQADAPGEYRGQCAEYCGTQHALMALYVVALPVEEFDEWIAQRTTPPPPMEPALQRGQAAFFSAGCASCHAIAGTAAEARIGPDLTHIGSRLTLGAGTVPNTRGNLAGWISNPQPIKPGNLMPRSYLDSQDLLALVEYLESLK